MKHAERNQKVLEAIHAATRIATTSKAVARETLIKEGIYTAKGELRPEFGGTAKKRKTAAG